MTVRVLVVDDSASMQRLLAAVLETDPEIKVVGTAADPMEARTAIKALNPDVVTLDVEMPGMNGIQFLEKIMALRPMPVVMISSHTQRGTEVSMEALSIGAFCCLPKPRLDDEQALREICVMVKQAAHSADSIKRKARASAKPAPANSDNVAVNNSVATDLIVIGSSTGGVEALTSLFRMFPVDCPPTVVTQHMPAAFTASLAGRLNKICAPSVSEARNNEPLERGHIYIAPGGIGHTTVAGNVHWRMRIEEGSQISGHMPSVDRLFETAASTKRGRTVHAALLTGMGADGAKGMLKLKEAGAKTIAQDEDTCLVYGMPAAAVRLGAAQHVLPLGKIASALFSD